MVRAVSDLIEFCYLVRRDVIDDDTLDMIDAALSRFHVHRQVFRDLGIRPGGFSLPRQHSLKHYVYLIQQFGAPNGLCSSITENKHIKAVKKPWCRSNRNEPLGQMLVTNQRLDKIAAARVDFGARDMLVGPGLPQHIIDLDSDSPPPLPPSPPPHLPDDDERCEMGVVDEPESQTEITLAKAHGTCSFCVGFHISSLMHSS